MLLIISSFVNKELFFFVYCNVLIFNALIEINNKGDTETSKRRDTYIDIYTSVIISKGSEWFIG